MLEEMGVVRASEVGSLRSNTEVLVAGVRIATQTPPMRSGKRVVFISLDDGSGIADATFFDEAQRRCSQLLFQNKLLLISGKNSPHRSARGVQYSPKTLGTFASYGSNGRNGPLSFG